MVAIYGIASKTSRRSAVRERPTRRGAGSSGAISLHSASLTSLAYLPPLRSYRLWVSSVQAIVVSVQLRNRTESQPAKFTQPVSDQPLRADDPASRHSRCYAPERAGGAGISWGLWGPDPKVFLIKNSLGLGFQSSLAHSQRASHLVFYTAACT